jgi:CheY-like chemotaxis protein
MEETFKHLPPSKPDQPVVLIAEDEPIVRNMLRIALESLGYFLLVAVDGEEALLISRTFGGAIHALVSDVKMPRMDGVALREHIIRERPTIKILFVSGQVDQPIQGVPFLSKPFKLEELKNRVRQLLLEARSAGGIEPCC